MNTTARHKSLRYSITTLIGIVCLHQSAMAATEEVLEVKLESGIYRGCTAIIGGERALFQWGATCFLLMPPDYSVLYLVNHENKTFLKQPIAKFMDEKWERKGLGDATALKRTGTRDILGYPCQLYECLIGGKKFWLATTSAIKVDTRVLNAACLLLEVPQNCGVPLHAKRQLIHQFKKRLPDGRIVISKGTSVAPWLFVNSVKKRRIDSSKLRLAKDYRVAKTEFDLMFSKDGNAKQSDLEDFFMSGH